jgi:kynurenine formamidase
MIIRIDSGSKKFTADLSRPIDISVPIKNGEFNPNCYFAEPVQFAIISSGDFVGSVKLGGSVNYQKLTITPHGNGTHTECYGHIAPDESATIRRCLNDFHFMAQLVTVTPEEVASGDKVITTKLLDISVLETNIQAIVIRTLPNTDDKKLARYSNTNPPYLDADVAKTLFSHGVEHLLIDLPSVDREVDGGELASHKAFWQYPDATRSNATITELIYVPDVIPDGLYLLNLQVISLEMDASPSKPVLYKLAEVY